MKKYEPKYPVKALYPPCSEEELIKVSNELGGDLPFPDDYLDFLRQWNGLYGAYYPGIVPLRGAFDDAECLIIDILYGISGAGDVNDLLKAGKRYAFEERVPSTIIAIGEDDHWNRLCMSLAKETYGRILAWMPGVPWEEGENIQTDEYLYPIADSFAEFWDLHEGHKRYLGDSDELLDQLPDK